MRGWNGRRLQRLTPAGSGIMDRRNFLASAGAASAIALLAGLPTSLLAQGGATAPAGASDAALSALMDRIFAYFMENNPEFATQLGLDTGPRAGLRSKLGDYSPAARAHDLAAFRRFKGEMDAIPRAGLSERSRLHYDTLGAINGIALEGLERFDYGNNGFGYSP